MSKLCKCIEKQWLIIALAFMFMVCHVALVTGGTLTPTQVVQMWIQVYPHHMSQAATLTTLKMRRGLSKDEWIKKRESALKGLQFRYLGGKVISEKVTGNQAVVVFHAIFSALMGKEIQEEQYRLRKQLDGGWLIDHIEIGPEHLLRQTM